jgi:hypothetical protein
MAQRPLIPEDEAGGRLSPEEIAGLADQYLQNYPLRQVAGKKGLVDEGLEYYSRVPGQRVIVNGQVWIHNPDNPDAPYRPYTASHAVDPTGQIYEPVDFGKEPRPAPQGPSTRVGDYQLSVRSPREAAGHLGEMASSIIHALPRRLEAARLGLELDPRIENQLARDAAAAIMMQGALPNTTREGVAALRAPAAQPRPQVGGQYRTRPIAEEQVPRGHVTTQELPALQARRAAEREARLRASMPETDEAGFYINALERGRRELPETATASEMRQALRGMDVDDAEASMLGLDRFLLGPTGEAAAVVRQAEQELGRLGTEYGKALRKQRDNPGNSGYADVVREASDAIDQGRRNLQTAQRQFREAQRRHYAQADQELRFARQEMTSLNRQIAQRKTTGDIPGESSLSYLYQARSRARERIRAAEKARDDARSADPGLRTVTRDEVLQHIRENRPRLGFEVREYPAEPYGAMTGPIRAIQREPKRLEQQLVRRGVDPTVANSIAGSISTLPPTQWGQNAEALASHMGNPGLVREAIEEAAGASIANMAHAWRNRTASVPGQNRPPRYKMAIPDESNETLREIAVVLQGPWSRRVALRRRLEEASSREERLYSEFVQTHQGTPEEAAAQARYEAAVEARRKIDNELSAADRPMYRSPHWSEDAAPIGHMQVTIQYAPVEMGRRAAALSARLRSRIKRLNEEEVRLNKRIEDIHDRDQWGGAIDREYDDINKRLSKIVSERNALEAQVPRGSASNDAIYMGNQFQSDWSAAGGHGFMNAELAAEYRAHMREAQGLESNITRISDRIRELQSRYRNANTDDVRSEIDVRIKSLEKEAAGVRERLRNTQAQMDLLEEHPQRHSLVENVRAWLRPVLEQYIDQAIRSGARYMGIPDGATVLRHNPGAEGSIRFYDETLRRELRYVMERRGLPYRIAREIDVMYNPTGDQSFPGRWSLIEIPRNARAGRGVRLMAVGPPPLEGGSQAEPAQYIEPVQLPEPQSPSERRYLLSSENLLPGSLPPLPKPHEEDDVDLTLAERRGKMKSRR